MPAVDVPVVRLDDLLGKDVPTAIKIDVEGHELAVLSGATETLRDLRLLGVVMETNGSGARYGVADQVLIDLMAQYGFAPFGYGPFARRLVDPLQTNGNTVFVRDREAVDARCRGARKFRLVNGVI